jgi:hypothetical protein
MRHGVFLVHLRRLIPMIPLVLLVTGIVRSEAPKKSNSLKALKRTNSSEMRTRSDREDRARERSLKGPVLLTSF